MTIEEVEVFLSSDEPSDVIDRVGNRNENSILMKNMLFLVSIEPEIHTEENCIS